MSSGVSLFVAKNRTRPGWCWHRPILGTWEHSSECLQSLNCWNRTTRYVQVIRFAITNFLAQERRNNAEKFMCSCGNQSHSGDQNVNQSKLSTCVRSTLFLFAWAALENSRQDWRLPRVMQFHLGSSTIRLSQGHNRSVHGCCFNIGLLVPT